LHEMLNHLNSVFINKGSRRWRRENSDRLFSDRFGRRRAMITALLLAILMIPLWAYAPGTLWLVLGAFLMQFFVQGAWGVIPAHITELSPNAVRGFLPGFAYQCGVLLAGSVAYIEAVFAKQMDYRTPWP
jgi:SHS family lactate transporter-like MFS transporter